MPDPPESLLKWAAFVLGEKASVVSVTGLHDGSSPWRLQVVSPDATTDAFLRTAVDPPRWQGGPIEGWEDEMGRKATDLAYWDALAALNTPADLDALDESFGRTDRRDAFLRAAVDQLV